MPLPTPNLDDLRFQRDLVDEARRRIIRYCPEWTDYNLSDPGITLIELFAWMTEMLAYRLNRVPDKNYIKFLEMLGVQLQPASSARVETTFYLSAPFPISAEDDTVAIVPRSLEVSTRPTEEELEITFTTDERLIIAGPRLSQLRREDDLTKNYLPRMGIELFYPFDRRKPRLGDTFYIGLDENHDIRGYVLRLTFLCEETEAVGVRREDPPLVWECSLGDGQWTEVAPSSRRGERDTTGGLNNPEGAMVFYLPLSIRPQQVHGRNAYWLRCRIEPRREGQGMYTESPRIRHLTAHALGATTWATHAVIVQGEDQGLSSGDPGQVLSLQHAPVLALALDEVAEVEEKRDGMLVPIPWQRVVDFSASERYDRHFCLDEASGQLSFGPAVRQPDGTVRQYGRVPEAGRRIRMSRYRYGGGSGGNVPAGKIQILRSAVPYIDRVVNLKRAEGGRDQESLEEAMMRARRELRAQQRAVTAEDFENLSKGASRAVARIKCLAAGSSLEPGETSRATQAPEAERRGMPPGMIELLVVPAVFDALRARDLSRLALEEHLRTQIAAHLDRYRLLTTTLHIREPGYLGIQVCAEIAVTEFSQPEVVRAAVEHTLRSLLSPLAMASDGEGGDGPLGPDWEGWPFGRDLYISEIYSLIQQVPGVKHVLDVDVSYRAVVPGSERPPAEDAEEAEPAARGQSLTSLRERRLRVPNDSLLCSLEHSVKVVQL